jgi:hypothetical protein
MQHVGETANTYGVPAQWLLSEQFDKTETNQKAVDRAECQ